MLILMLRSLGHLFNKEPRGPVFKQQWWPFVQRQGHKVNIRYGEAGAFIVLWISYHHLLRAWRLYGAFSFVSLKLPSQQTAALTTVVSTIHLNLAGRIWQSDAKQAARKQPKDEYTSILPNLCTGTLVFLWDVMRLSHGAVCYPPAFWAVYAPCWYLDWHLEFTPLLRHGVSGDDMTRPSPYIWPVLLLTPELGNNYSDGSRTVSRSLALDPATWCYSWRHRGHEEAQERQLAPGNMREKSRTIAAYRRVWLIVGL